jgi:hypothetical protein
MLERCVVRSFGGTHRLSLQNSRINNEKTSRTGGKLINAGYGKIFFGLLFDQEDVGDMPLRYFALLSNYASLQPKRLYIWQ